MGVLAAEDGLGLSRHLGDLQGIQVMRRDHEVRLGGQLVGGVAPVCVGKGPQPPRLHEAGEPVLDGLVVRCRAIVGVGVDALGQFDGSIRVRFEGAHDVHPVQAVQVVEMHDVVAQVPDPLCQISDQPRIGRRFDPESILAGHDASLVVYVSAHAAETLSDETRVARVAALEDRLDAPPQRDAAPGIPDRVRVVQFYFYP